MITKRDLDIFKVTSQYLLLIIKMERAKQEGRK